MGIYFARVVSERLWEDQPMKGGGRSGRESERWERPWDFLEKELRDLMIVSFMGFFFLIKFELRDWVGWDK